GGTKSEPPDTKIGKFKRMPRKSSAARVFKVSHSEERLRPPADLTAVEKKIFVDIVSNNKAEHFKPSDLPLLVAYAHAIPSEQALAHKIVADNATLMKWERTCRVMNMLSHRLRLSPVSRTPTHTAPRPAGRASPPLNYFERMKVEGSNGNGH